MQSLSNAFCSIEMFRYDGKYQKVYILAITSRGEEIELEVNKDGEVINLWAKRLTNKWLAKS